MSVLVPSGSGILTRLTYPLRKVVIVGQTRVGGFLCTIPALRAFRHALPNTEMVMIAPPTLRDLVDRSPHLDRFVAMPDLMLEPQCPVDARGFTQFLQRMQEEHFDLGIQLRGYGLQASPFFPLLGAALNVGFAGPSDLPLLDAALPFPKTGHLIDRCLSLATFLGVPPSGRHTEFVLDPEDHVAATSLLAGVGGPLIGIHPGASEQERVWRPERFAAVARELQRDYGGTIVLLGDKHDSLIAERIGRQVSGSCLNLAGKTSLPVLGAIIKRLSVFIANDSGPAHIAYALEVPVVTLFASATQTLFWPPDIGPFRPLTCDPANISLDTITVDQVIQAAEEVIPGPS